MQRRAIRLVGFAIVVAGHAIAILLVPPMPLPSDSTAPQPVSTVIFFLPPQVQVEPRRTGAPPPGRTRSPVAMTAVPRRSAARGNATENAVRDVARSAPPAEAPPSVLPGTPPPAPSRRDGPVAPDFLGAAQEAAAHEAAAAQQSARRAGALTGWRERVLPSAQVPRPPPFRWYGPRVKRFEPTPGGLLIHVNERCVVLVSPLALVPGCQIGEIPIHGDLFDGMHERDRFAALP